MKPPQYSNRPASFWDRVETDTDSDCWLWTGSLSSKGYGYFWLADEMRGALAHRHSAEDKFGAIPKGLLVLHTCDVRNCVYHEHLYYGTAQDNADDAKQRGRWTHGEMQASSKLTEKKVLEARRLYSTGAYKIQELADKNGVRHKTMSRAIRCLSWMHI